MNVLFSMVRMCPHEECCLHSKDLEFEQCLIRFTT